MSLFNFAKALLTDSDHERMDLTVENLYPEVIMTLFKLHDLLQHWLNETAPIGSGFATNRDLVVDVCAFHDVCFDPL